MFRNFRLNSVLVPLAALAVVLTLACHRVEAQVKPFKITGGGVAPFGLSPFLGDQFPFNTHNAVGQATELGKYSALGRFQLDAFTGPLSALFSSAEPCVFIAANGDRIQFDYAGTVELATDDGVTFTGVFIATFTPVLTPGANTGRFEKVIGGSFVMVATTKPFKFFEPNAPYTWEGNGTLEFRKGK